MFENTDMAAELKTRVSGPFQHHAGHCFVASVPNVPPGDGGSRVLPSALAVEEDGRRLGPGSQSHAEIASTGAGAYSHWSPKLFFSASDGSDPNENGRSYSVWLDDDVRNGYVSREVDHVVHTIQTWFHYLGDRPVEGLTVCEVGPGNLGCVLALSLMGMRCVVVDRTEPRWDEDHAAIVDELCRRAASLPRPISRSRVQACVDAKSFVPMISACTEGLENIPSQFENVADVTLSASTLEHVADAEGAVRGLFKLARKGGVGIHAVDFRDHRDFTRPLDFLLLTEEEYRPQNLYAYSSGNRVRPERYRRIFEQSGFEHCTLHEGLRTDELYRRELLARLRASARSPYRDLVEAELTLQNAVIVVKK